MVYILYTLYNITIPISTFINLIAYFIHSNLYLCTPIKL